jgi:MscS family membrane protein
MTTKGLPAAARFLLLLVSLFGLPGPLARAQEASEDKHRSPRATVRTFLTAITVARRDPQLIREAASCLDLSGLPADQQNGPLLATQLEAVLRGRDVDTELIPDQAAGTSYVFPDGPGGRIALRRMPDGRWLFDRDTVARIPQLHAAAQKHLQDKNKAAADLNVTPEYASARATVRTLVVAYRRQDFDRVLAAMDLGDVPPVARREVGRQLASKLRQIIVRQPRVILQEIPDSNYGDPFVWVSLPEGVVELVRLPSGDRKGEWVFSRETVRSIDNLYRAFEDKPYREEITSLGATGHLPDPRAETAVWLRGQLPGWLKAGALSTRGVHLEVYQLLGCALVPALAFGVYRLATWLLEACLQWGLARRGWALPRETVLKRLRPTGRWAGLVFLRWGLLALALDRALLVPVLVVLKPLIWVLAMWAVFRLIDLLSELMEAHLSAARRRPEITQMLWPVTSLALKIGLFVATLFRLMILFDWDVTAVLTGLGIGGLAFALGAQDSLKNLFGSFTLIADRPFVVGETVKIGDHDLGVVEVVGLRSTRIRTTDDTLLVVPNSNLTTMNITNFGRRRYRRYATRIGVVYSTPPERLSAFRDGIREVIRRQERTRKDHFEVAVHELTASAVEVLVNVYFEVADRHQELAARDALILDVLRLAEELNVELAFPTQTVHLVPPTDPTGKPAPLPDGLRASGPNSPASHPGGVGRPAEPLAESAVPT